MHQQGGIETPMLALRAPIWVFPRKKPESRFEANRGKIGPLIRNQSRTTSMNPAPRILIVRVSAIGDVIHGIPVLCALRDKYPHAFLAWVAEGPMGALLEGHPALDELVRVPRRWWKSPREVWRMRQRLRKMR